jgi:hypothetical protein
MMLYKFIGRESPKAPTDVVSMSGVIFFFIVPYYFAPKCCKFKALKQIFGHPQLNRHLKLHPAAPLLDLMLAVLPYMS